MTLDLVRLWTEGSIESEFSVLPEDDFWDGTELHPVSPLKSTVRAVRTTTGDVLVTGRIEAAFAGQCRRCLTDLPATIEENIRILFVEGEELAGEDGDGSVRILDPGARELDLVDAMREEVLLAFPPYLVCVEGCRGLCAQCGTNLNETDCDCAQTEDDPRWAPLRALRHE